VKTKRRQIVHRWTVDNGGDQPPPPNGFFRGFMWAMPVSLILWLAILEALGLL
jgi:hypothetical protein